MFRLLNFFLPVLINEEDSIGMGKISSGIISFVKMNCSKERQPDKQPNFKQTKRNLKTTNK